MINIFGGCTAVRDHLVSPSRIELSNLESSIKTLREDENSSKKRIIIAHGAGSYNNYPMNVTSNAVVEGNNKNPSIDSINELIDTSFTIYNVDAIEIDVVAPNNTHALCKDNNNSCSFILHNMPDWDLLNNSIESHAFKYMRKNDLREVLNHFVKKEYYKDRRIYLEQKVPFVECSQVNYKGELLPKCFNATKETEKEIKNLFEKHPILKNEKNDWLYIVSFSAPSLKKLYETLKEKSYSSKIKYALILGYDTKDCMGKIGIKGLLGQLKGPVPEFDESIEKFIIKSTWLNEIWFSTKGMQNPQENFEKFHITRIKNNQLNYSVSHYDVKASVFKDRLKNFTYPLTSIMIDIDD